MNKRKKLLRNLFVVLILSLSSFIGAYSGQRDSDFIAKQISVNNNADKKIKRREETHKTKTLKVILDTDIGGDNDDVAAVAILHALADSGKVDILAMGVVSTGLYCPACLDAINTYYGRGNIPIGVIKKPIKGSERDRYSKAVAEKCPNDIGLANQVQDVVQVYRKALAGQPDASVTMIAIGMMDNLVNLLNSPPDEFSKLSGINLVKKKVTVVFVMAPYFDEKNEYHSAWNFIWNPSAAAEFLKKWPTKIKFGEGGLGSKHYIGSRLSETPAENPVRVAFEAYSIAEYKGTKVTRDRHCADPTTIIYAICGTKYFNEIGPGSCDIRLKDGFTRWDYKTNRRQYYNSQKLPIKQLEEVMNQLLLKPPSLGLGFDVYNK